jgi:hypothetical protein
VCFCADFLPFAKIASAFSIYTLRLSPGGKGYRNFELHSFIFAELVLFELAPEICVEVLSPSNSAAEINEKLALYFDAGATEVWICNLDGPCPFLLVRVISSLLLLFSAGHFPFGFPGLDFAQKTTKGSLLGSSIGRSSPRSSIRYFSRLMTGKIQAKILSLIATITSQKRTRTDSFRENNPIDELVVAQT